MAHFEYPRLILSDPEGNVFDHASLKLSGRSGNRFLLPPLSELVPLPKGSRLFTLPGRIPIGWDEEKDIPFVKYIDECWYCGNCEIHCPRHAIDIQLPLRVF